MGPTRIYDSYLDHSLSRSLRLHCTFHIIWWVGGWETRPTAFTKNTLEANDKELQGIFQCNLESKNAMNDDINLIATMITGVMMMVSWWRMEEEMVRAKTSSKGLQRSDW